MNERLLQYIWQHLLFQSHQLKDIDGQAIQVLHPGTLNTHEGPDFIAGRIKVNNVELVGNIEIHIQSSDWLAHQHQFHPAYQHIILHVVFINDMPQSVGNFPTLEIGPHIPVDIIEQYQHLVTQPEPIACKNMLSQVPDIITKSWIERMLAERLQQKAEHWYQLFLQVNKDWRTTLYIKLAENFGFKVNAAPMQQLAQSIPLSLVEKIHIHEDMLMALFFGQGNLLPKACKDTYVQNLLRHYTHLKHQYSLEPIHATWKFLRMRPANFPSIRIAQFASLMSKAHELFAALLSVRDYTQVVSLFDIAAPEYWDDRYTFKQSTSRKLRKHIGRSAIENILINTVAQFQYFYGIIFNDNQYKEQAIQLLQQIPAEKNAIISQWKATPLQASSAYDTQALLHLFQQYCIERRCLQCAIGHHLCRHIS